MIEPKEYPIKITSKPLLNNEEVIFEAALWSSLTGGFDIKYTRISSLIYTQILHTLRKLRNSIIDLQQSDAAVLTLFAYNDIDSEDVISRLGEFAHTQEALLHPLERRLVTIVYITYYDDEFYDQMQRTMVRAAERMGEYKQGLAE